MPPPKRISLWPVAFEEALSGLLQTPPAPKRDLLDALDMTQVRRDRELALRAAAARRAAFARKQRTTGSNPGGQ